ncbi:MAG: PP2C family protein-serine/threonine phosphatase [Eubacteriales bacterium]|nr:PP2C family protein-serine/threonine phosphatase [Eubacteriales bacterium]
MKKNKKKIGIIGQVAIFFVISILVSGFLTFYTQHVVSDAYVKNLTESLADQAADEVRLSVMEYPAHDWLLCYWYEHFDELEIEYDTDYEQSTVTREKCELLHQHCPTLLFKYAAQDQVEALSPEDQKLYAEITYSWLITRINQIKRSHAVDYLFCVSTDNTYREQFFLFSAAEKGAVRGTNYEEAYTLGTQVTVGKSQQDAMRNAKQAYYHLADAGKYVDYYSYLTSEESRILFIGMTYDLTVLKENIRSQTISRTAAAVFYQFFLSVICLALIANFILRPLKGVQEDIRFYKDTKRSKDVIESLSKIQSRNEIGQLAEDVIDLAREIDDYTKQIALISAEEERIGTELALAARIQEAMLPMTFPPFPNRKEFDIYASMDPAKEVGGDFYDFFFIDDDHLCLVIADVSGKGIPAAMFMTISKIILANTAKLGKSPAETLENANSAICPNNTEEMFVTVWMGILELSTGILTASNAGHEYPIVKQPDGKFEVLKDRHGFVIGGMDGLKYRSYELRITPGSILFLYTDGLPEATDAEKCMFGTDRILTVLNENPGQDPEQILHTMTEAVAGFVKDAEQFDDLTMLCLRYNGPCRDD